MVYLFFFFLLFHYKSSALLPMLLIVGIIIGAVVVIVSLTIIVLLCMERKTKRFDDNNSHSETPPPDKIAQFSPPAKAFIIWWRKWIKHYFCEGKMIKSIIIIMHANINFTVQNQPSHSILLYAWRKIIYIIIVHFIIIQVLIIIFSSHINKHINLC